MKKKKLTQTEFDARIIQEMFMNGGKQPDVLKMIWEGKFPEMLGEKFTVKIKKDEEE